MPRHGRPPLSQSALYSSANFSLSILPARLAYRIQALRNLPFIVVTNPHVAQIHDNYMHSLSTLLPYSEHTISTPEEEDQFTDTMTTLVHTHANTIPVLARGFLESRKYISAPSVTRFLDEHLRYRIGTRLIAEQHIALHNESVGPRAPPHPSYIGIIDTALRPVDIVRACEAFVADMCEFSYGVRPSVAIDGDPDLTIAHVPVHLEYIITELLKNAFRATIEHGCEREPVHVTIAPTPEGATQDAGGRGRETLHLADESVKPLAQASPGMAIRIRDRGGGIAPENQEKLWTYGFTTFNEREASSAADSTSDALNVISGASSGVSSLAGLGYGLPLGRAYAEYFGGSISVQSLHGYGTDIYLKLQGVGKM